MPAQCRVGDLSQAQGCPHNCPACPHGTPTGPAIKGSPTVRVNNLPAIRVEDPGMHVACCNANTWKATKGSGTVFINGKAAHRVDDDDKHCNVNSGKMITGSPNVTTGD